ncbi:MAG: antitoxin Xre/MbcA/ParS toxin-binding domain-containing protein [Candidatus Marinimicrobia bacterium]|nr:antitoxin Xre/MbcA/ParS toxin-binding domain-containing protein [Candidatus Neomarinimicrobiota bacterium]
MNNTSNADNNEKLLYAVVNSFAGHQVNEPAMAKYRTLFENKVKLNRLITSGLSYSLFEAMQDNAPFSKDEWAHFLDVSVKTLDRYRQDNKRFRAFQSEKIIGMIEVIERGVDVFGDMGMFKRWLYTPIPALSDSKPIELLSSSYGKELVLDELTRIEHGIFA